MLIMLDGFDEVKKELRNPLSKWIAQQLKNYPQSFFILTSRPYGYRDYKASIEPKTRLFVKPFNDEQQERFIKRWYHCREKNIHAQIDSNKRIIEAKANQKAVNLIEQIKERPELEKLARNPLMLNLMVSLHSLYQSKNLPKRRSELYKEIVLLQLGDRPLAKDIELILVTEVSLKVLQGLALFMIIKQKREIEYTDLIEEIKTQFNRYNVESSINPEVFLEQIEKVSELIVKIDDYYEFAHLSFQEYLASKEIIETKQDNLLIDNWDKSWWRETILLYSAQVNPNNLLRQLIEIGSDEALKLAKLCLNETPRKIDEDVSKYLTESEKKEAEVELENIESQVDKLLFKKLEEYLKNGQWKEADEETTRLMLQLGDKDEKGYLNSDDCRNFPREELRTIDRLWLDNSEGKFGFSVQKRIYLEEGGKLDDYDYDSYKKMSDRIGWYKNNKWLSYSKLLFDNTTAPQGHLPAFFWVCFWGGVRQRGSGRALWRLGRGVMRRSLFSSLDSNT